MKILHVINSFEGGGAEKLTLQIHQMCLQQGIDSHALSLMQSSAGSLPNAYSLGFDSPYQLSVPFKLYSFLSQPQWKDINVIHVHLFPSQLFTPIISRYLNLKASLITTEHSTVNWRRNKFYGKLIDKIFYSFYQRIICVCSAAADSLLDSQPQLMKKITTIHNGIDIQEYLPNSTLKIKGNTPIIISIGRLVELKNYATAIRALNKISEQAFEYWILGSGVLEYELRELVNSLNLESKVKFLGFRTDVPDLLHQADIFLLTSLWEGFNLSLLEAMAAELPVIVSNVPGVREAVTEESDEKSHVAFLVEPLSEDDIANKLSKLLADQNLRLTMGKNAQIRSSRFDIKQTVTKYIDLYQKMSVNNLSTFTPTK
ncbi:glycosyl transferase [Tolypothrix sp. NIES-4075]|uniref:glycosyltransferase family 4 protein n=1 Tax=Tolypothrix sp. NIES-4075 TaxID=2005459 RepID=UPI000B5C7507|nr:glycosyltransferase family 4 protein [Tolypothrix sp. NIES-4075]GAX39157.1 glycosyl transferase [Tolypothrix sp. NIES-4075]